MAGAATRARYLAGQGYWACVGVEADRSGRAHRRMLGLADSIGALRPAAIEMTAASEAALDLFVEQTIGPLLGSAVIMGTIYRDSLTRQGYGKAVDAVLAANAPKFTGVVPAEGEDLLEELTVYGSPPEARRRLARWHAAGCDFPVLLLRPNLTPEERLMTLEAFRPMLRG